MYHMRIATAVGSLLVPWIAWLLTMLWFWLKTRDVPSERDTGVSFGWFLIMPLGGIGAGIVSTLIACIILAVWARRMPRR